jgi:hypothetical protein
MAVDSIQFAALTSRYNCKGNYSERPQGVPVGIAPANVNKRQIAVDNFMDRVSADFSRDVELSDKNLQSESKQSGSGLGTALSVALLSVGIYMLTLGKVKPKSSTFVSLFDSTKNVFKSLMQSAKVKFKKLSELVYDFLAILFDDKHKGDLNDLIELYFKDKKKTKDVADGVASHVGKETVDVADDVASHFGSGIPNPADDVASHFGAGIPNPVEYIASHTADDFSRFTSDTIGAPDIEYTLNNYDLYSSHMNNSSFHNYSYYSEDIINSYDDFSSGFDYLG